MGEVAPVGDGDGAAMRRAVRRLSLGAATEDERAEAAGEVGRLARSDERTKRALPELGVVPPLVSMLADAAAGAGARLAAARALLELARGTHRNKVHIVKAGLLKKLPRLMDLSTSHDLALLLLSVSSLANTDFPLSTADLLPFLVATLGAADVPADTRLACLAALRDLSAKLEHVRAVVTSGAVRALLALSLLERTETTAAEAALGVLADVASASAAGRREMAEDEEAPRALVEAMARHESAGCQEHATYLVMALAHGGGGGRALRWRMRQLGAVQALLEVSLLGSPLARSRAAKILQWFKDDGQDRIRAHSGPRMEAAASQPCHGNDGGANGTKACRSAVDRIVKQSLDMNMRSIMRRATASVDMTNAKQLVASSSSKSLPC
ncbi:hypothetical protein CFC21_013931 [Triticum aestivum]|uniref:Uncharacterized protein n=3 Tax=Triticum aestivum TaxID=4565 RepID=A0A3B6A1U9_WHEAT|nr:hypothetical protein CFC21_013931 [Triticum aestivum]